MLYRTLAGRVCMFGPFLQHWRSNFVISKTPRLGTVMLIHDFLSASVSARTVVGGQDVDAQPLRHVSRQTDALSPDRQRLTSRLFTVWLEFLVFGFSRRATEGVWRGVREVGWHGIVGRGTASMVCCPAEDPLTPSRNTGLPDTKGWCPLLLPHGDELSCNVLHRCPC